VPGDHREYLGVRATVDPAVRIVHAVGGTAHFLRGALAQRAVPQGLQLHHHDIAVYRAVLRHRLLLHMRVDQAEGPGARQAR